MAGEWAGLSHGLSELNRGMLGLIKLKQEEVEQKAVAEMRTKQAKVLDYQLQELERDTKIVDLEKVGGMFHLAPDQVKTLAPKYFPNFQQTIEGKYLGTQRDFAAHMEKFVKDPEAKMEAWGMAKENLDKQHEALKAEHQTKVGTVQGYAGSESEKEDGLKIAQNREFYNDVDAKHKRAEAEWLHKNADTKEVWSKPFEMTVGGKKAVVQASSHGKITPVIQDKSTTIVNSGGSDDKQLRRYERVDKTIKSEAYKEAAKQTSLRFKDSMTITQTPEGPQINFGDSKEAESYFNKMNNDLYTQKAQKAQKRGLLPSNWVDEGGNTNPEPQVTPKDLVSYFKTYDGKYSQEQMLKAATDIGYTKEQIAQAWKKHRGK